jgi:hypothetical protein
MIGRQQAIAKLMTLLEPTSPQWLVVVHGLNGIGKTTLLRHLHTHIDRDLGPVWIDLDNKSMRDYPTSILDAIEFALRIRDLPQTAWEVYEDRHDEIYRSLDLSRLSIKQEMILKAGATISNSPQTTVVDMDEALARLERGAWFAHTQALLEVAQHANGVIPVFIDHWDSFVERGNSDIRVWFVQDVLLGGRQLLAQTEAQLRVFIGSDRLIDDIDDDDAITNVELGPLSYAESQQLMAEGGLEDPRVHASVFDRTAGNPLLINLALTLWREDPEMDLTELVDDLSVRAASKWLLERIIDRLSDKRSQAVLIRGVIPQSWTLDTLAVVCEREDLDFAWFDKFTSYPFVQDAPVAHGWKSFVRIVREIQIDRIWRERRPWFYQAHRAARDWFVEYGR